MGEAKRKALAVRNEAIALDTFGGRIHVEGDPAAAVTPLGQLPFFIQFLKVIGVFEAWVADCPLAYHSIHASDTRAVLITSTPYEILALAQLYRDRADAENHFDELKNPWGWGGFTTRDKRASRSPACTPSTRPSKPC